MSQMNFQWDGSQGLSHSQGGISSGGMQDPALVFASDLMLDYEATGRLDPLMVDDLGFQDMQDLPWYVAISIVHLQRYLGD